MGFSARNSDSDYAYRLDALAASLTSRSRTPQLPPVVATCGVAIVAENDSTARNKGFDFSKDGEGSCNGKGKIHESNVRRDDERNPNIKVGNSVHRAMVPSPVIRPHEPVLPAQLVGEGSSKVNAVAICDLKDNLMFEMKGPLVNRGTNRQEAETKVLTSGLIEALKLGIKRVPFFCDSFPLFQYPPDFEPPFFGGSAITDVLPNFPVVLSEEAVYIPPSILTRHHITESTRYDEFFISELHVTSSLHSTVEVDKGKKGKAKKPNARKVKARIGQASKGSIKKKKPHSELCLLDKITATNCIDSTMEFYGPDSGILIWQVREPDGLDISVADNWTERVGPVRSQKSHDICWIYVATDLVSCWVKSNSPDEPFVTLSARYIAEKIYSRPEVAMYRETNKKGHKCFGSQMSIAFQFMKDVGVPQEEEDDVKGSSCLEEGKYTHLPQRYKLNWEVYNDLRIEKLVQMLSHQPVGASVQVFQPDYDNLGPKDIYFGPQGHDSHKTFLHAVIIVAVERIGETLVAKCKSSHGRNCHDEGFLYVSLTTMFSADAEGPRSLITRIIGLK